MTLSARFYDVKSENSAVPFLLSAVLCQYRRLKSSVISFSPFPHPYIGSFSEEILSKEPIESSQRVPPSGC